MAEVLERHALSRLEVSDDRGRIVLERCRQEASVSPFTTTAASNAAVNSADASSPTITTAPSLATPACVAPNLPSPVADGNMTIVRAPLLGIAYRSREPDTPPFVRPGETVAKDTTLCLIEAMKMFSEIKAPATGTIQAVHFENAALVEHGAPLFTLSPSPPITNPTALATLTPLE
jgi:acetyl-CoA carboxylase biotin carboxyl carrier protein